MNQIAANNSLPGMRPWKSKEGSPLVNPDGNPAANSGFLWGRSAPNEAGRAGRWAGCWRAGLSTGASAGLSAISLAGVKVCSGAAAEAKDDGAPPRVAASTSCSRWGRSWIGRSCWARSCWGRCCWGRRNSAGGAGRKACCNGTPAVCCLADAAAGRDPASKSTCLFCWFTFLLGGKTGTCIGLPTTTLLPIKLRKQHDENESQKDIKNRMGDKCFDKRKSLFDLMTPMPIET